MRPWIVIAAIYGATGVALAAYGAHGLEGDARLQSLAERASLFQMIHALALLAADRLAAEGRRAARLAQPLFALGVLLFAGTLVLKIAAIPPPVPMLPPIGGVMLMLGWACLGLAAFAKAGPSFDRA